MAPHLKSTVPIAPPSRPTTASARSGPSFALMFAKSIGGPGRAASSEDPQSRTQYRDQQRDDDNVREYEYEFAVAALSLHPIPGVTHYEVLQAENKTAGPIALSPAAWWQVRRLMPCRRQPRPPRARLQTRSPLQYPQAQDERRESQHDHPIFKEDWSDLGLIEKERQYLIPHFLLASCHVVREPNPFRNQFIALLAAAQSENKICSVLLTATQHGVCCCGAKKPQCYSEIKKLGREAGLDRPRGGGHAFSRVGAAIETQLANTTKFQTGATHDPVSMATATAIGSSAWSPEQP